MSACTYNALPWAYAATWRAPISMAEDLVNRIDELRGRCEEGGRPTSNGFLLTPSNLGVADASLKTRTFFSEWCQDARFRRELPSSELSKQSTWRHSNGESSLSGSLSHTRAFLHHDIRRVTVFPRLVCSYYGYFWSVAPLRSLPLSLPVHS